MLWKWKGVKPQKNVEESKSADEIVCGVRCEYCQTSKFIENMGIHLAGSNRPTTSTSIVLVTIGQYCP
ncbi:hypothetical protein GQ55_1G213600 [Panicum hallii var. hallii]|uniref:Uncharacterized protein n=1 Tax=Panicum hallii var. hallii TaxID=1504633 RepID=A0A2T7F6H3_9POAL|nr:hypothetical protein GQ55_1G213600 [Panicum hallii var. hallii]